ncbi:hypothetical protein GCM10020229_38170 [Kitasatospora albolonga]
MPVTTTVDPVPRGLTEDQARRRLAEFGPNSVEAAPRTPWWARVAAQLRDPLITVLLAAVALTVAIGDHADATVIALVIVVNTVVGVVQEIRADHAVSALTALSAPTARVLREGEQREVPPETVVPGDVLVLGEGDIVPADAALVQASALLVDESMLTGESVPVEKEARPGSDVLQAGTVVLRGRARAVGHRDRRGGVRSAGSRGPAAPAVGAHPAPAAARRTGPGDRRGGHRAVPAGLRAGPGPGRAARGDGRDRDQPRGRRRPGVAARRGHLALALGARRMAARQAVVRRLAAVETLGSVTVLATDKTGTLTEGRMVAERVWTPAGQVEIHGDGLPAVRRGARAGESGRNRTALPGAPGCCARRPCATTPRCARPTRVARSGPPSDDPTRRRPCWWQPTGRAATRTPWSGPTRVLARCRSTACAGA